MVKKEEVSLPVEVRRALVGIRHWRGSRARLSKMPEGLWADAADAARKHGVSRVATALNLGYGALKRRVESGASASVGGVEDGFVELSGRDVLGADFTVELIEADGRRVVLRVPPGRVVDAGMLVVALWWRP